MSNNSSPYIGSFYLYRSLIGEQIISTINTKLSLNPDISLGDVFELSVDSARVVRPNKLQPINSGVAFVVLAKLNCRPRSCLLTVMCLNSGAFCKMLVCYNHLNHRFVFDVYAL